MRMDDIRPEFPDEFHQLPLRADQSRQLPDPAGQAERDDFHPYTADFAQPVGKWAFARQDGADFIAQFGQATHLVVEPASADRGRGDLHNPQGPRGSGHLHRTTRSGVAAGLAARMISMRPTRRAGTSRTSPNTEQIPAPTMAKSVASPAWSPERRADHARRTPRTTSEPIPTAPTRPDCES